MSHAQASVRNELPSGASVVTVEKNKHPVLTFIGGAVLVLFVVGLVVELANEGAASDPVQFSTVDALVDEGCTVLGDYCVRVHCTYQNVGSQAGEKRVVARLFDPNDQLRSERQQALTLLPNGTQRVTFDFPEALVEWGTVTGRCSVQ
jgi:hypothetical protein